MTEPDTGKLKTLKDLDGWDEFNGAVSRLELKQEAIKWVKYDIEYLRLINKNVRYSDGTENIPLKNFGATSIDQRTYGSKTYSNYKGVCVITCSNVAIQRKLMYLSNLYCKEVTKKYWGA